MNHFLDVMIYVNDLFSFERKDLEELKIILQKFGEEILKKENKLLQLLKEQDLNLQLDLSITNTSEIQQMNKINRQIDQVTDVLSFPNYQFCPEEESFIYQFAPYDLLNPDDPDKRISLGEIVICSEKVQEQAQDLGHSYLREFLFLFMHGFLHLCGYDHLNQEQESLMFGLQKNMLNQLNQLLKTSHFEGAIWKK